MWTYKLSSSLFIIHVGFYKEMFFAFLQVTEAFLNGHSNLQMQIIGLKMSPVLEHVKVPDPHQGALNYSSVSWDLV